MFFIIIISKFRC